jgi:hypothetical protein
VCSGIGFGGRCDDCRGERGVLDEPVRELVSVDRARSVGVLLPQRRGGDPGDVPANDHFDAQRVCRATDGDVRVGNGDEVVGHDRTGAIEPPCGELVEHLTLVRDGGDDAVERRQPVGGDEQQLRGRPFVRHTNLSCASIGERQLDLVERGGAVDRGVAGDDLVHSALAWATPCSNR